MTEENEKTRSIADDGKVVDFGEDSQLPKRLLSVDCYTSQSRLNIYSKLKYLGVAAKVLMETLEWDLISNSQFVKFFMYPVARCTHLAKFIHSLICRQLITNKNHELWFVYGGKPLRFSIREFRIAIGLHCGPIPSEEEIGRHQNFKTVAVWYLLFGEQIVVTVHEIAHMLEENKLMESANQMYDWKRLCLVLILIVYGVVVGSNKYGRITHDFVEMLDNIDFFLAYSWGRVVFNEKISRFGPPSGTNTPLEDLKIHL